MRRFRCLLCAVYGLLAVMLTPLGASPPVDARPIAANTEPQPAPVIERIGGSAGDIGAFAARASDVLVAEQAGTTRTLTVLDTSNPNKLSRLGALPLPIGTVNAIIDGGEVAFVALTRGTFAVSGTLDVVDLRDRLRPALGASLLLPGRPLAAQRVGTRVYITTEEPHGRLSVVNVADPARPALLGSVVISESGNCSDLAVVGTIAVLPCGGVGLQFVNVADPVRPALLNAYRPPNTFAASVAIANDVAYVGMTYGGLHAIRISDPSAPVDLGSIDTDGVRAIELRDNRAYLATERGVSVLDISDPAAMRVIAGYETAGATRGIQLQGDSAVFADNHGLALLGIAGVREPALLGNSAPLGEIRGVGAANGFAYVVAGPFTNPPTNTLAVFDARGPGNPVKRGTVALGRFILDIAVRDTLAYLAGEGGLWIYSASDPLSPTLRGSLALGGIADTVDVDGTLAALAVGNQLRLVNVANPAAPVALGSVAFGGGTIDDRATDLRLAGGFAYLTFNKSMLVVDVRDTANPQLRGRYDGAASFSTERIRAVDVMGSVATVVIDTGLHSRLETVDVHDPLRPQSLGGTSLADEALDVVVADEFAWVSYDKGGLVVVDLRNPSEGRAQLSVPLPERTVFVAADATRAYTLGEGYGGLRVFDRASVAPLESRGSYDSVGEVWASAQVGELAYLIVKDEGLVVVDISDPTLPHRVASRSFNGDVLGVSVHGGYAYVANGRTLQVFDISEPRVPKLAGSLAVPNAGAVTTPQVSGTLGLAYYTDTAFLGGGIVLLDMRDPTAPQVLHMMSLGGSVSAQLVGNRMYIFSGTLTIYDVSTPADPRPVGDSLPLDGYALSFVDASRAYMFNKQGLRYIDITNIDRPLDRGGFTALGQIRILARDGNRLYVTDEKTLFLLDATDPFLLSVRARFPLADPPRGFVALGDTLVLAGKAGITTFAFHPERLATVASIGPAGGTLVSADGTVRVTIPAGALGSTTTITLTPVLEGARQAAATPTLRSCQLGARTVDGAVVSQFQAPISIAMSYTDAEVAAANVAEASLAIGRLGEGGWVSLFPCAGCSRDGAANRVTAATDRLGAFALQGNTGARVFLPVIVR